MSTRVSTGLRKRQKKNLNEEKLGCFTVKARVNLASIFAPWAWSTSGLRGYRMFFLVFQIYGHVRCTMSNVKKCMNSTTDGNGSRESLRDKTIYNRPTSNVFDQEAVNSHPFFVV